MHREHLHVMLRVEDPMAKALQETGVLCGSELTSQSCRAQADALLVLNFNILRISRCSKDHHL